MTEAEEHDSRLLEKIRAEAIVWTPFDYANTPDELRGYESGPDLFRPDRAPEKKPDVGS